MKYELTIFKNQFDNKTHKRVSFDTWDKFVQLLYGLSNQYGEKGGNNSSPLISPAIFEVGTTRSNKSTLYWGGWCCVDVDEHDFGSDIDGLRDHIHDRFGEYDYVVYNTASSRPDHLKFRLVFRTDEMIENDRIKSFWYALNTELGELGDPQTKDLARMYYVPAQYPNATSFFFTNQGKALNVSELIAKHPYHEKRGNSLLDSLPLEFQQAVISYKKNKLNNTNFNWSSYHDCPFWPKTLASEYMQISDTGWYSKMYHIMVAVAGNATKKGYPLTSSQIAELCKQFDMENGNWYENRPLTVEAERALEYVYRNGSIN
jgi:hypothetical protein